jgi:hypothetical protein
MASFNRDLQERLWFVRYWAAYVKRTPNSVWSRQQVSLINSVLKSANADPKLYLKVKNRVHIAQST